MAVLFITHKFPPSIGGMQKQSYELINGVRQFEKVHTIIQSPIESKFSFFFFLIWRIRAMIKKYPNIKVIHCNDAVVASICSIFKSLISVNLTATFHGLDIVFPNRLFQKLIVPRLRKLDKVFVVSKATAQACFDRGFRQDQVSVVLNGVDRNIADKIVEPDFAERFRKVYGVDIEKNKVIISIGRAVKRKGFSWFVNHVLPQLDQNVKHIIIGPTISANSFVHRFFNSFPNILKRQFELFFGYASDSIKLDKAIQMNSKCVHVGKLPYEDMMQLLALSDLMVMPNIRVKGDMEGFGLVALEAGLSKTYVVAADLEGIQCAVQNGSNGSLLPTQDVEAWVAHINALLSNPKLLKEKSEIAAEFVLENYSWNKMAVQYLHAFRSLGHFKKKLPKFVPAFG